MIKHQQIHRNNTRRRDEAVAVALANLNKAQQHNVLQFKVISARGHLRVWRFGSRDRHVDWWPYHKRAKLRYGNCVTKHRVLNVDHCLDLLDYSQVNYG